MEFLCSWLGPAPAEVAVWGRKAPELLTLRVSGFDCFEVFMVCSGFQSAMACVFRFPCVGGLMFLCCRFQCFHVFRPLCSSLSVHGAVHCGSESVHCSSLSVHCVLHCSSLSVHCSSWPVHLQFIAVHGQFIAVHCQSMAVHCQFIV